MVAVSLKEQQVEGAIEASKATLLRAASEVGWRVRVCVCVCVCVLECVYTYSYMYINVYMYIKIYIYT
jgi:hypothetical protein